MPSPQRIIQSATPGTMISAIRRTGLATNLQLCLDASDYVSYPGSGQTWVDRSGNGVDFYLGSTSGVDATDPAFNGTAGRQSSGEYFSSDGDGKFKSVSNPVSFVAGWHKAGAAWSVLMWAYQPVGQSVSPYMMGNGGQTGTEKGFAVSISRLNDRPQVQISGGASSGQVFAPTSTGITAEGVWQLYGWSWTEGAGTSFVSVNGTTYAISSTVNGPSAAAASNGPVAVLGTMSAGALYAGGDLDNGGRVACVAAWNRMLSTTEHTAFFQATRAKFGV